MRRLRPGRLAPFLLAVCLLGLPASVRAEETSVVEAACRGVIAPLIEGFRDGDEEARRKAEEGMRARARFALPYVLSAAECTADGAFRARCLEFAEALQKDAGPDAFAFQAPRAEFPDWESGAGSALQEYLQGVERGDDGIEGVRHLLTFHDTDGEEIAALASRLAGLAEADPERLHEVLEVAANWRLHNCEAARGALGNLATFAQKHAESAGREAQAETAWLLARWYRDDDRKKRLAEVAKTYAGTPAGLLAECEHIRVEADVAKRVAPAMQAFADAHPGTEAARKALETVAFHLGCTNLTREFPDVVERFRRLAGVAARLESSEFPGSEGPIRAVNELNGFFVSDLDSKEKAKALLDAYRVFFRSHLMVDVLGGEGSVVGWSLPHRMEKCHLALGVPADEVEAKVDEELAAIERDAPDKAGIQYLRAERRARAGDLDVAIPALEAIEKTYPDSLYARKALAARAGLAQLTGDFERAEELYAAYLEEHPASAFAWVAALRIGHCRSLRGDVHSALAGYQEALSGPAGHHALLQVLAHAALARGYESTGEVGPAIAAYRQALAAWQPAVPKTIGTQMTRRKGQKRNTDPDESVSRSLLELRLARLDRPGVDPVAVGRLMQGKRLLGQGDEDAALGIWGTLVEEYPGTPIAAEASDLIGYVWISRATKAVDRSRPVQDEAKAREALAKAKATDARFAHLAAALVDASLMLRKGSDDEADRLLGEALGAFAASQTFSEKADGLEGTVAEIRSAAFQPRSRVYDFEGAAAQADLPFVAVRSTIEVVHADGRTEVMDLRIRRPDIPNLLYFEGHELERLAAIIGAMGTLPESMPDEDRAEARGSEVAIARLLGKQIPVRHGHWGGWLIGAFPMLHKVHLQTDDKATVPYRIGWGGGNAIVKHVGGRWRLVDTNGIWIE